MPTPPRARALKLDHDRAITELRLEFERESKELHVSGRR